MKKPSEINPKPPETIDNSRLSNWHFVRQVLIVAGIIVLFALISNARRAAARASGP